MSFSHSARSLCYGATLLMAAAAPARSADVTIWLESVTKHECTCRGPYTPHNGYCGYYDPRPTCMPVGATPALSPAPPAGGGTIDLDTTGVLIEGSVGLQSYTLDGAPVAAWTRAVERREPELRDGFLSLDDGWGDARLFVDSFVGQGAFTGHIENRYSTRITHGEQVVLERYRFATLQGSGPGACAGSRLYFDEDGDGEEDSRDLAPRGLTDPQFGTRVDPSGRTVADFCLLASNGHFPCGRMDFLNDEPRRKKPLDCRSNKKVCVPAAPVAPLAVAPFSGPTCLGLPMFADLDHDGEGDATDLCPLTPTGARIDGSGCSADEFCAAQSALECKRSDFMNDEHGVKKPHDCALVQGSCVAR